MKHHIETMEKRAELARAIWAKPADQRTQDERNFLAAWREMCAA